MIPTLLLGRDCCRGRRHRRHGHNVFGPRRRREGHLERRERVALDAEEEASVAAERVDERRLGVRRRDLAQIQLALANYGTHKEVADGNSDARFDLIAAFVASGRGADLYTVEAMPDAVVDDKGIISAAGQACKQDAAEPCETFSIKVVAGWEGCNPDMAFTEPCEAAEEFNVITNTAIADGVITDA